MLHLLVKVINPISNEMANRRQRKKCQVNNTKFRSRNKTIKNRASQEIQTRAYSAQIPRNSQIWTRNQNCRKAEENNIQRLHTSNANGVSAGFSGHSSPPFSTATPVNPLFWVPKAIKALSSSAVGLFSPSTSSKIPVIMGNRNEISRSTGRKARRMKQLTNITRNTSEATHSSSSVSVNGGGISVNGSDTSMNGISINGGSISMNGGTICVNGVKGLSFGRMHMRGGINIISSTGRSKNCINDMSIFTTHSSSKNSSSSTVFSGRTFKNMGFGFRDVDFRTPTYQTRRPSNRSSTGARPTNSSNSSSVCISDMASRSNAIVPACASTDNRCETSSNHPSEKSNARQSDSDCVTYLYSVDKSTESRLVEEVNLGDEYEVAHLEKNNQSADTRSNISEQASRKRKKSSQTSNAKKQNSSTASCTICSTDFPSLQDRNENMYSGNCGHVFCHPCIRNMGSQRHCKICNKSIISFCKLFL